MSRPPSAPPQIDGFTHLEHLGGGGFADVFLYAQENPKRDVAVKVLLRGLGGSAQAAFEAEANLMAHLSSHPSIVNIYQVGVARDGRPFIVMERCRPEHLGTRARRRPLAVDETLRIGIQIAGAVETAHRAGIVHRDIKPANILLSDYDEPLLTDFGISESATSPSGKSAGVSIPRAPPEQLNPDLSVPVGPAADVYALGATLYTLLAGRSPFELADRRLTAAQLVQRALTAPVPPIGRPDVPAGLEQVLATAMAKRLEQRYQSALEFARALQQVQTSLSMGVTRIQVRDDAVPQDQPIEEDDGATRIESVSVIDPDGPTGTGTTVGAGQDTATSPGAVPLPRPAAAREFTRPPQALLNDTVRPASDRQDLLPQAPAPAPAEPEAAAAPSRPAGKIALVALAGVALLIGGVVAVNLLTGDGSGGSTRAADVPTAAAPVDAVGSAPPVPEQITGVDAGTEVQFTWVNPDPQAGDSYLYRWTEVGTAGDFESTDNPAATLARRPGQTCIEVVLVRSDGQGSDPATHCVPTP